MYTMIAAAAMAALTVAVPGAMAQQGHDHSMMMPKPAAQPARSPMAEGEVRKVDKSKGTVTLKHGPLDALGMPPMTMVFVATDAKLLANVKEGDKVRFTPEQGKDGQLLVSRLEVVK